MIRLYTRMVLLILLVAGSVTGNFYQTFVFAAETNNKPLPDYAGFYTREGNNEDMAKASGHNEYIKFYPETRIVRLYIPFPYAKNVTADSVNRTFDAAVKESTGSAYIKSKFGVMDELVVAHLDTFRWIDGQVMYDCDKPKPCRVEFAENFMTVIKPGMVLEHKIRYELVRQ
jgi:hypothetical protein